MTEHPAPVAAADRIVHLDVFRGLAILGILMVNAPAFAMPFTISAIPDTSPLPFGPVDAAVWWTMRTFFEAKFITLFSLLFGVSIYLVGGEWGREDRAALLKRRLFWLAVIGLVHGAVIWFGDILLHYALVGALMSQFRSWAPRRLIKVGLILFAVSAVMVVGMGYLLSVLPADAREPAMEMFGAEQVAKSISAMGSDNLLRVQSQNLSTWTMAQIANLIAWGPRTLGLMMIGLALFKLGVLQGRASTRTYLLMVLAGALSLTVIGASAWSEYQAGFPPEHAQGRGMAANFFLSPLATLGYVGLLSLLLRGPVGAGVARVLAPVGRMAFTNYLTQSLIMTAIFYGGGRGLGLFGELDWPQWTAIVVAIWALQLVWSSLWLSRFSMGPLEWVWRRLSYGRGVPLSRAPLERPAVPAG